MSPATKTQSRITGLQLISSRALLIRGIPPSHVQPLPTQLLYALTTSVFLPGLFDQGSSNF